MQDIIYTHVKSICRAAKEASRGYASTSTAEKNALLNAMADQLVTDCVAILAANAEDLAAAAENGVPKTMLDRLKLDEKRLAGICCSLREVAAYCGMTESKCKMLLYRTRIGLKEYLVKEGFDL